MKTKKRFFYEGIELRIVEREEPYLNTTMTATRAIGPNGGVIPVNFSHRQTLKSMAEQTIGVIEGFKRRGSDVIAELTKPLPC